MNNIYLAVTVINHRRAFRFARDDNQAQNGNKFPVLPGSCHPIANRKEKAHL